MAIKLKTPSLSASSAVVEPQKPVAVAVDLASGPDQTSTQLIAGSGTLSVNGEVVGGVSNVTITPAVKVGSFLAQKLAEKVDSDMTAQLPQTPAAAPQEAEVQVTDEVTALAEELVDLNAKMIAAGAYEMVKRIEELKKLLAAAAADKDPAKPVVFNSPSGGTVVFSAAKRVTEISDKAALMSKLGQGVFESIAKVTLTDAKKYLSEIELGSCTTVSYGSRSLQSITPPKT